jgi:hypothetical protein
MAQGDVYSVERMVGWTPAEGHDRVIVGFELTDGEQFGLAVTEFALIEMIATCISSIDAFPAGKLVSRNVTSIPIAWVEAGDEEAGPVVLSFRLIGGGSLSLSFERDVAQHILQALSAIVGRRSIGPPPGVAKQ